MSKKRDKENNLSEKFSSLIYTKPSALSSDDEDIATVDKITPNDNDSQYSADELEVSKIRRINNGLLEEDDSKYSGKAVSRKQLTNSDESDVSEAEDSSNGDGEDSFNGNDESGELESGQSDDENVLSENESDVVESDENNTNRNRIREDDRFNQVIISKASDDIEKGLAIKNQLHLWDFMLECRLKFQKCLAASNQFPSYENFDKFKTKGGSDFEDAVNRSSASLKKLLSSMLKLQEVLLKSNEEFLTSFKKEDLKTETRDEEIQSDSEDDSKKSKFKDKKKSKVAFTPVNLEKLSDFSLRISNSHKSFETYRNNTIQKWNDKTKIGFISNKNFSAFEQSTLKQIEHILLDRSRLIRRTQTKRSNYNILGEKDDDDDEPPNKKATHDLDASVVVDNKSKTILHKEIFDDDDFYHQLLSELVKRKANDVTDPVQLGRQWMQLQKIRSKMKKTVDVKASKGRKVRFVVHPKLVNFMMPIDNSYYNEESRVELFNSLFGKSRK